jgi:TonB family protein
MHEKIQGNVELEAVVRTDGTVGDISVLKSLDQKYGLDDAAVSAAKQWVFKPGTKDGKPVNVRVVLVLTFRLKSDGTPASAAATEDPAAERISAANVPAATDTDLTNARALFGLLTSRVAATSQAADDEFTRGTYTEFTPDLVKPRVVRQPEPKYTSDAMKAKIQGDVLIDAVVGIDGTVIRARITRSLDAQFGLDDEALRAGI